MAQEQGQFNNRSRQYTSASSAENFSANPIGWITIVGTGSTVMKDEAGTTVTYTTDASLPSLTIAGPFNAFTSTTATRVLAGDGTALPVAVPASAVPATTAAVGGTTMSVAPASAATPIAVGNNDPRVCQVEIPVFLTQADASFAESPVWIPGVAATITGVTFSSSSAITQNNTNYTTFTLGIRDGAGGAASTVASKATLAAGANFVAFQAVSLGAITNATTTATSQVTFKSVIAAAGQAVTGTGLLRITYTVP